MDVRKNFSGDSDFLTMIFYSCFLRVGGLMVRIFFLIECLTSCQMQPTLLISS